MRSWSFWVLLIISAYTTWLLNSLENKPDSSATHKYRDLPDYTLKHFVTSKRDENGDYHYQLQAVDLYHYPVSDAELIEPYLIFYQKGKPSWYIRANQGQISVDGKLIYLPGKSVFWYHNAEGERLLSILVDDVILRPQAQTAETYADVHIYGQEGSITHARGMHADLGKQKLHLQSAVRAIYPTQTP